jgi:hypothetical protein
MRVNLTINLTLPEGYTTLTDQELRTILYEEFIRTVHQAHLESALDLAFQDQGGEHVSAMLKEARKHHLEWAKITDVPDWTVERL